MGSLATMLLLLLTALAPVEQPADFTRESVQLAQALTATGGEARDPDLELPKLVWTDAEQAESAWMRLKSMTSPASQAMAIHRGGVDQMVCRDLIDFREVAARAGSTLVFRDQFRGRSWVRPSLARVLLRAAEKFASEYPDVQLTLGDIAQPGCGQLAYGTLVRQVTDRRGDPAAQRLLARARRVLGEPMIVDQVDSSEFPLEADRFRGDTRLLVEQRVVGVAQGNGDDKLVRLAVRRFVQEPLPNKPRAQKRLLATMLRDARRVLTQGEVVRQSASHTWDAEHGQDRTAYLQHRVDRKKGMQVLAITTRPMVNGLELDKVVELRIARWRPGKPESFAGETRWRPIRDEAAQLLGWDRWRMLGEAGHVTHLAGRDVDISYASRTNQGLSHVRLKKIDAKLSMRWFQLLAETAASYGTPVERIWVGPRVRAWLKRKLPSGERDTVLWRQVVQTLPGHDAHHHLRLASPSAEDDAQALAELRSEPLATARR